MLKIAANLSLAVALISATPAQSASYQKVPYRFHALWCKVKEGPDRLFYQRCREGDKLAQETSQTLRIDANTAVINKKGETYSCWLREPVRDIDRYVGRLPHGHWASTGGFYVSYQCAPGTGISLNDAKAAGSLKPQPTGMMSLIEDGETLRIVTPRPAAP